MREAAVESDVNKNVVISKSEAHKKKAREERPLTKVVIRRLPPTMTEECFLKQVSPLPEHNYFYFVPASDPSLYDGNFSRAYINFINLEDLLVFTQKFDNYIFLDHKGHEYAAVVEFAPFQRIPKRKTNRKKDSRCGTIDNNAAFINFKEQLESKKRENKNAALSVNQHYFDLPADNGSKKEVTTTPLIDFLKSRYNEWQKYKENKREERRLREIERKRIKDDLRRERKEMKDNMMKEKYNKSKENTYRKKDVDEKAKDGKFLDNIKGKNSKGKFEDMIKKKDHLDKKFNKAFENDKSSSLKKRDTVTDNKHDENQDSNSSNKKDAVADKQKEGGKAVTSIVRGSKGDKEVSSNRKETNDYYEDKRYSYKKPSDYPYDNKKYLNKKNNYYEEQKYNKGGVIFNRYSEKDYHNKSYKSGYSKYEQDANSSQKKPLTNGISSCKDIKRNEELTPEIKHTNIDKEGRLKSVTSNKEAKFVVDDKEVESIAGNKKLKLIEGNKFDQKKNKENLEDAVVFEKKATIHRKEDAIKNGIDNKLDVVVKSNLETKTRDSKYNNDEELNTGSSHADSDSYDKPITAAEKKALDVRPERRIKNKDRPALEIYRPGMGKFSRQRFERNKSVENNVNPE